MRIGPNIPFHVAKAYGVQPAVKPAPAAPTPSAARVAPPATTGRSQPADNVQRLIGGNVRGSVDFDAASTARRPAGPVLQLYTRCADTVEAATGVQLGRTLDITG